MGIDDERPASAFIPTFNILPDEVFQHFRFSGAGCATDIEMRCTHLGRHLEWIAVTIHDA